MTDAPQQVRDRDNEFPPVSYVAGLLREIPHAYSGASSMKPAHVLALGMACGTMLRLEEENARLRAENHRLRCLFAAVPE